MYNGPYLRVLTPRTTNGNNPVIVNDMQQYRESHLPLSARAHLETLNRSTPQHLRKKIEVVDGYADQQRKSEQEELIQKLQAELAQLKAAQLGQVKQEPAEPKAPVITKEPAPQQLPKEPQAMPQQPAPAAKPKPATPNVQPQNQ